MQQLPHRTWIEDDVMETASAIKLERLMTQDVRVRINQTANKTIIVRAKQSRNIDDVARRVRLHKRGGARVVVTVDNDVSLQDRRTLFHAGAVDCIARPQRVEQLWRELKPLY